MEMCSSYRGVHLTVVRLIEDFLWKRHLLSAGTYESVRLREMSALWDVHLKRFYCSYEFTIAQWLPCWRLFLLFVFYHVFSIFCVKFYRYGALENGLRCPYIQSTYWTSSLCQAKLTWYVWKAFFSWRGGHFDPPILNKVKRIAFPVVPYLTRKEDKSKRWF